MNKQIKILLIGLFSGVIMLLLLRKSSSNGISIDDFIPIITVIAIFTYQNYRIVRDERNLIKKKMNAISESYVFAYDNLLISKSESDKNVIKVRNDLFWIEVKQKDTYGNEQLLDSLISDFKKLSKANKTMNEILTDKTIEFSLIDNINYDADKILAQKIIEYKDLNSL